MDRMKTFLTYVLLIIGFFILSLVLENGLLFAMYSKIDGELNGYYENTNSSMNFENISARACNINGYISFDLKNTTGSQVQNAYLKIDLYNELGQLSHTEYAKIDNMEVNENKKFNFKFKANDIRSFDVSIVNQLPDKANIINILGWEIDLTNVFGLGIDLSNVTIFGTKLTDIFTVDNIKTTGHNFWDWLIITIKGVPGWAYFVALFFIV